jgi:hypothetical protein
VCMCSDTSLDILCACVLILACSHVNELLGFSMSLVWVESINMADQ